MYHITMNIKRTLSGDLKSVINNSGVHSRTNAPLSIILCCSYIL